MKKYYERYKHAIPLIIYGIIYLTWFSYLERTVTHPSRIILFPMVCICFRCCPILLFQKQAGICQYMHLPIYRDDRFSGDFHALAKRTSPPSLQHAQRKYFYRNDRTFVPHRYAYQLMAEHPCI